MFAVTVVEVLKFFTILLYWQTGQRQRAVRSKLHHSPEAAVIQHEDLVVAAALHPEALDQSQQCAPMLY